MFTDEARREFIKRFEDFPDQVIAMAWAYAVGLTKFSVDLSKEWATVTHKRADLDLAYRRGVHDERQKWRGKAEEGET